MADKPVHLRADSFPEEERAGVKGYNPIGEELKVYKRYLERKKELLDSRTNVHGQDLDSLMRRFDRLYFRKEADIPASELDPNQKPLAINNAFGKIQTALGLLIGSNPKFDINENHPTFSKNRELLKGLTQESWANTNSQGQFKLSIYNAAKRGWFVGRTFNRAIVHDARYLSSIDNNGRRKYETHTITKLDDIAYMSISNYNAWIDEQSRPEDFYSTRDWMWREVWQVDDLKRAFPEEEFPNIKLVTAGGDTSETYEGDERVGEGGILTDSGQQMKDGLVEVFFYENQYQDQFIAEAGGVMFIAEPLPQDHKNLSCIYAPWHLRSDDSIYGIGVVEEMENDEELIDRIINMDMRQLLLTINPPGFYNGPAEYEDENIRYSAGTLRRVVDPNSIKFLEIPQGNQSGLEKVQWLETKQDDKTGITQTIQGSADSDDKTAFQVGVEREAGLKRLRVPLKSLQYALSREFENRLKLVQQTYSDYRVEQITEPQLIQDYLEEVEANPQFFFIENQGHPGEEQFYAKRYPERMLNLEQDEQGKFVESEQRKFFRITPEMVAFKGSVTVDIDSLLVHSEQVEQAETLRMVNLLMPMLSQPMEIAAKPAKQLLQKHNMSIQKWLPDEWVQFLEQGPQQQQGAPGEPEVPGTVPPAEEPPSMESETLVPPNNINAERGGILSRFGF